MSVKSLTMGRMDENTDHRMHDRPIDRWLTVIGAVVFWVGFPLMLRFL